MQSSALHFLQCTALHYYAVITVMFCYYTVSMHDVSNATWKEYREESGKCPGITPCLDAWTL